jgi:hypothetical protein
LADSDPEDLESNPSHSFRPEAGVDIHPPLSKDEEYENEGLEEETKTVSPGMVPTEGLTRAWRAANAVN